MLGKVTLFGAGVAVGVAAERIAAELRKPAADQFPAMRRTMNERVNPWLLEHGYPGSAHAEIATLEHTGRRTGGLYFTPVHPTVRGEMVVIPAPLGDGSQWARNVLASGHARLQLHEELLDLERPELITVTETGMFPPAVAGPFDRMGWRYVRFRVAGRVAGTFATHRVAEAAAAGPHEDAPLDRPFTMPSEPTTMEPAGAG